MEEVEVVGESGYQFNWKSVMLEESLEIELVLQRIFGYGMQESKAVFLSHNVFSMNGFPGKERSVEVTARVAVAAGSPVVRTRSGG